MVAPATITERETTMAGKETGATVTALPTQKAPTATAANTETRQAVSKEMRPLYMEIARLSSTLGIARKACYDNEPGKALEALELLGMQLPAAQKLAGILAPKPATE